MFYSGFASMLQTLFLIEFTLFRTVSQHNPKLLNYNGLPTGAEDL